MEHSWDHGADERVDKLDGQLLLVGQCGCHVKDCCHDDRTLLVAFVLIGDAVPERKGGQVLSVTGGVHMDGQLCRQLPGVGPPPRLLEGVVVGVVRQVVTDARHRQVDGVDLAPDGSFQEGRGARSCSWPSRPHRPCWQR